jgi:GT2 family glycosyltransferase
MTEKPSLAAVVLNYNCRDRLEQCLRSLENSTYPISRIIVADNGSTDGSITMVKDQFPRVVLVENGFNLGAPAGRNRGISKALLLQTDYIYTLDNDLTIAPDAIEKLIIYMESDQTAGCCGSAIYYEDQPDVIFSAGQFVDWTQNLVRSRGMGQKDRGQFAAYTEVDYVGTGAMLCRRTIYEQIGLLDEDYIGYGYEDTDFGMRVWQAGFRVVCCMDSKTWHMPFSGIGRYSFKKKYLETRNAIQFIRKYGNGWSYVKYSFYTIGGIFYAAIREGLRGNMRGVLGKALGLVDGIRGRTELAYQLLDSPAQSAVTSTSGLQENLRAGKGDCLR